jgi:adenylosuccinate lyase
MTETYESFSRLNGALKNLSLITDNIDRNLEPLRKYPSEAMVTILRGEGWVHPTYGVGHDFVKEIGKMAIRKKKPLLEVALEDPFFSKLFNELPFYKQDILSGKVQVYLGTCDERTAINIADAKKRIESGQFAR